MCTTSTSSGENRVTNSREQCVTSTHPLRLLWLRTGVGFLRLNEPDIILDRNYNFFFVCFCLKVHQEDRSFETLDSRISKLP